MLAYEQHMFWLVISAFSSKPPGTVFEDFSRDRTTYLDLLLIFLIFFFYTNKGKATSLWRTQ